MLFKNMDAGIKSKFSYYLSIIIFLETDKSPEVIFIKYTPSEYSLRLNNNLSFLTEANDSD